MIKYLCSDCEDGTGQMILADTPQEAFEEYKAYWDDNADIEDLYIYGIDCQLKGKANYTFEPVGT
jgi:hypothetical protein